MLKKIGLLLVSAALLAGCNTIETKKISEEVREVKWKDGNGKILSTYHEIYSEGNWYEAEKASGVWRLSPKGELDKKNAMAGGGGGGGC